MWLFKQIKSILFLLQLVKEVIKYTARLKTVNIYLADPGKARGAALQKLL